eukprot:4589916-Prymnesium_polylepis.1
MELGGAREVPRDPTPHGVSRKACRTRKPDPGDPTCGSASRFLALAAWRAILVASLSTVSVLRRDRCPSHSTGTA